MKSAPSELLKELCAASARTQTAHGIAHRAGLNDLAKKIEEHGKVLSGLIGRIATNKFEAEASTTEPTFD